MKPNFNAEFKSTCRRCPPFHFSLKSYHYMSSQYKSSLNSLSAIVAQLQYNEERKKKKRA
jgi:hypothetical protein